MSEQSYIEELEDRINILEDLCSDYSAEIGRLKRVCLEAAANKFSVGIQGEE